MFVHIQIISLVGQIFLPAATTTILSFSCLLTTLCQKCDDLTTRTNTLSLIFEPVFIFHFRPIQDDICQFEARMVEQIISCEARNEGSTDAKEGKSVASASKDTAESSETNQSSTGVASSDSTTATKKTIYKHSPISTVRALGAK